MKGEPTVFFVGSIVSWWWPLLLLLFLHPLLGDASPSSLLFFLAALPPEPFTPQDHVRIGRSPPLPLDPLGNGNGGTGRSSQ